MAAKRILFVQYASPAGYPPLQHAARILARDGWRVLVLGVQSPGMQPLQWPADTGAELKLVRGTPSGARLKMQYAAYAARALYWAARRKPAVVYASDPLAAPIALLLARLSRAELVYHEHDSPARREGLAHRVVARLRIQAARTARFCVLPNANRIAAFIDDTGALAERTLCVWNCPSLAEIRERPSVPSPNPTVYFHGSINAVRLPLAILDALAMLPANVRFAFAGYETLGAEGYVGTFLAHARRLGLASERVAFLGAASRSSVLDWASRCDIGLALVPLDSRDINMRFMVGASNKPFDYLAAGLALVVSRLRDWEETFVQPGYAASCDPSDARSIAAALAPLIEDAPRRVAMARAGLRRVQEDWNYERQFRPLLQGLNECIAARR